MNMPEHLIEFCKSKPHMWNGKFYLLHIFNTINYQFLLGNTTLYENYITHTKQAEHSSENFKALADNFDIDKMPPIKVSLHEHSDFYWLQDGVHRICTLHFKRVFENGRIPLRYLDISISDPLISILKDKLKKTTGNTFYNGWNNRLEHGYHSFNLWNFRTQGQRNPLKRIEKMARYYNFQGKSVLDLGCNTGGMILHLHDIKSAIGVDFDPACIDFASYLSKKLMTDISYDFKVRDLNEYDLSDIPNVDVAFILSLGSWVKDWRGLYERVCQKASSIFLETNNAQEGAEQLAFFMKKDGVKITNVSTCSDDDITGNLGRATYLIQLPAP